MRFGIVKQLLLLLVACMLPLGLLMADTDIQDASVGEEYGLTHDVGRISTFTTKSNNSCFTIPNLINPPPFHLK
jgi:hypothetical protein